MKKEFLSNLFLILGLNLLIKPVYVLLIDTEVQNIVGPKVFGLYFALFNFTFLVQFFLDFGIQNYSSQYIASDRKRFEIEFTSILGSKVILAFLFYLILLAGFFILGFPIESFRLLLLIGIQIILLSFLLFIRGNISALGFYRLDSIFSAMDKLILVLILGWYLYFSTYRSYFEIDHFLYAQIIATGITLVSAFTFLRFKKGNLSLRISFPYLFSLVKKSMPFAIVLLLMNLYTRMDGVMLERLLNDNGLQAGIYAAGYRIMDALNMIGFLFATLLLPMFAHIKETSVQNDLAITSLSVLTVMVGLASLGGIFYAADIMNWLYIDADHYYAEVFSILMYCFAAISIAYIFGSMITAKGNLKKLNVIYGLGIIINWTLNLVMIPKYFALGAAWSTLATQVIVLIGLILISVKDLKWEIELKTVINLLVYLTTSATIFYLIKSHLEWTWVMEMSFSVLLGILVSFLLGIVRLQSIRQLFR